MSDEAVGASLVVVGSGGFIGRAVVAAGGGAIEVDGTLGRSPQRLREALRGAGKRPAVLHADGSVARHGLPDPRAYLESTGVLIEAVAEVRPDATVITLGSIAEVVPGDSPYAVIKREQARLAAAWSHARGLLWRGLRLHGTIGPGQTDALVGGALARRIRHTIDAGRSEFHLDECDAVRDLLDVRDLARILRGLAAARDRLPVDPPLEVCYGQGRSVREIAEALIRVCGVPLAIRETPSGPRGASIVWDPSGLQRILGADASPRIDFEQSITDLWNSLGASPTAGFPP